MSAPWVHPIFGTNFPNLKKNNLEFFFKVKEIGVKNWARVIASVRSPVPLENQAQERVRTTPKSYGRGCSLSTYHMLLKVSQRSMYLGQ